MQSADPDALAGLGLATLQEWLERVEKAVANASAKVARNAHRGAAMQNNAGDEFAGYSLNDLAAV